MRAISCSDGTSRRCHDPVVKRNHCYHCYAAYWTLRDIYRGAAICPELGLSQTSLICCVFNEAVGCESRYHVGFRHSNFGDGWIQAAFAPSALPSLCCRSYLGTS